MYEHGMKWYQLSSYLASIDSREDSSDSNYESYEQTSTTKTTFRQTRSSIIVHVCENIL